ncbi:hypothetical protein Y1Q_0023579 [Alligator mississippiensis]|uniref:Secreted protein n=1 Tax=Alligator mississippiensis TaxID=8496 RepID=A0A151MMK7_ALLMI|nr:hypothetical protein Y1Q_0023579 [Alligator mississippiensis]
MLRVKHYILLVICTEMSLADWTRQPGLFFSTLRGFFQLSAGEAARERLLCSFRTGKNPGARYNNQIYYFWKTIYKLPHNHQSYS